MEENLNEDFGIFQNQEDVVENLKDSAKAVGVNIDEKSVDKLKDGGPIEVLVAKNNCKWCYGRGTVRYAPNKLKKDKGVPASRPSLGYTNDWRSDNMVKALCKCVKARLV